MEALQMKKKYLRQQKTKYLRMKKTTYLSSAEILWQRLRQYSEYTHVETALIKFETPNKSTILADIINVYEIGKIKFEMDIDRAPSTSGRSHPAALCRRLLRHVVDACVEIKFYGAFVLSAPDTLVDFHTGGRSASPHRPDPSRSRGGF